MSNDIWVALIEVAPLLLAIGAGVLLVLLFRKVLEEKLLKANKVVIGSFALESAGEALETARPDAPVPDLVAEALVQRTKKLSGSLVSLRILWVDDRPLGNQHERRYFRAAGITVVNAVDTESAMRELRRDDYDIVVTDFARESGPDDGILFANQARREGFDQPFVAYIGRVDPTKPDPRGFYKVTDRPDDLVSAVLELAEARDRRLRRTAGRRGPS
ncbi:hypothetical protein [Isoptericola sp. AK164]|uniref:hypothetical protein n=1 Tax=Isoptericola sp. AK164 TaxID=3024246 RepID=UPI0024187EDF|nr:hypothetical protein [Isoptericola sp. AK164]